MKSIAQASARLQPGLDLQSATALKGRQKICAMRRRRIPLAPSGQDVIKKLPRVNPGLNPGLLCFQGPSGRRYCTKQSVHFVHRPVRTAPRPGMREKEQCVNRNILVVSQATIAHPPPTSMAHPCSPLAPLGERGLAITRSPSSRRSARRDC